MSHNTRLPIVLAVPPDHRLWVMSECHRSGATRRIGPIGNTRPALDAGAQSDRSEVPVTSRCGSGRNRPITTAGLPAQCGGWPVKGVRVPWSWPIPRSGSEARSDR